MTCELCEQIVNFVKPFVDSDKDEVCKNPEHMAVYNVCVYVCIFWIAKLGPLAIILA